MNVRYTDADLEEFNSFKKRKEKDFIQGQIEWYPGADSQVLEFIIKFYHLALPLNADYVEYCEYIRRHYRAGYCYYFALILKDAFNRGELCWAAPFSHIVWKDTNDIAYDIEGVHDSECKYYIPIEYLGEAVDSFKHVPGRDFIADEDFIDSVIKKYEKDLESGKETKETGFFS